MPNSFQNHSQNTLSNHQNCVPQDKIGSAYRRHLGQMPQNCKAGECVSASRNNADESHDSKQYFQVTKETSEWQERGLKANVKKLNTSNKGEFVLNVNTVDGE